MAFSDDDRDRIFSKTNGRCHICHGGLCYSNYARRDARGAWEVEHSKARANGGRDELRNLWPAHIGCNRSKGTKSTRSQRYANGVRRAPYSRAKQNEVRVTNGAVGGVVGAVAGMFFGNPGAGAAIGAAIGAALDPD